MSVIYIIMQLHSLCLNSSYKINTLCYETKFRALSTQQGGYVRTTNLYYYYDMIKS